MRWKSYCSTLIRRRNLHVGWWPGRLARSRRLPALKPSYKSCEFEWKNNPNFLRQKAYCSTGGVRKVVLLGLKWIWATRPSISHHLKIKCEALAVRLKPVPFDRLRKDISVMQPDLEQLLVYKPPQDTPVDWQPSHDSAPVWIPDVKRQLRSLRRWGRQFLCKFPNSLC
jgi:hypothetical protein